MTDFNTNYDEEQAGDYTLPDPLMLESGATVTDATTWFNVQRPYLHKLFEQHVYGAMPAYQPPLVFDRKTLDADALGGAAISEEITIYLTGEKNDAMMTVLFYYPRDHETRFHTFLGLNFGGNHTIQSDDLISVSDVWRRNNPDAAIVRGEKSSRWPVQKIIERGYGLATIYCDDIAIDSADQFVESIQPYLDMELEQERHADDWGAIGVWAWGLSRAMDYFDARNDVNKVAVMGHSRLGKAALWAGASDERFALVISNNSGCMGAALSRRNFGETVTAINTRFPHWFRKDFHRYNDAVDTLPVDQHTLISLIAPRPVYVASAEDDLWADPYGEFLGAKNASPVYELLGKKGIDTDNPPPLNQPHMTSIGYHKRSGGHDVTDFDWDCYLDFADLHLD